MGPFSFFLSFFSCRVQDIRATEKDKVQVYRSFRPGDIVRAQVISLGDARSYYLATTKNDLGVIFARSEAGEFLDPTTQQRKPKPNPSDNLFENK